MREFYVSADKVRVNFAACMSEWKIIKEPCLDFKELAESGKNALEISVLKGISHGLSINKPERAFPKSAT